MTAEDDSRWGDRCVGSTLKKGRLMTVPMASVGNGMVNGTAGGLPGRKERLSGRGVVPGLPFSWLKGAPLRCRKQTDPLVGQSACFRQ